jgi:transcriptional regulator with XRE-family HTH domain
VKGITQERLSEMVDVNPRHISKLETGGNFPSAKILFRLCVALRVQPWELFGFEIDLDESD